MVKSMLLVEVCLVVYSDVAYNKVYRSANKTWEAKVPLPAPRGFHFAGVVNNIFMLLAAVIIHPQIKMKLTIL